ncbi:hypothetical protein ACQ4M3_38840 [Leptolyngbya sp. AN03gr2]|uniref:hypothetical protein n=1 Tax=unclassified Leptolyngbya TaxID=2650499 RepID=UPI003D318F27
MTPTALLAPYKALVQDHQAQFNGRIKQLHTIVTQTLSELQQQEQPFVTAQAQFLEQLCTQLAIDARCLLNSVELTDFVAEVNTFPPTQRWTAEPVLEIDADSVRWLLTRRDLAVSIRDYVTEVDHDAYDDERTHTTYGYRVTIAIHDQTATLSVITQRIYSPTQQESYNLRQLLDYDLEPEIISLLKPLALESNEQAQLSQELAYLLGCAIRLLAITPVSVQFRYPAEAVR